jgi:hypothetical protein
MNADGRRWLCRSLLFILFGAALSTHAQSEELQSQLGAEIEKRFEESAIDIDDAPLDFGCSFSKHVTSRVQVLSKSGSAIFLMIPPCRGSRRLEEPVSLPRPTFVEMQIAKGFPSGEAAMGEEPPDDGYSYLLAEENRMRLLTS